MHTMRILSLLTGILLVLTGIWCFANTGFAFASFAFVPGVVILIYGLCSITAYIFIKKRDAHEDWRLADGVMSTIFGSIILADLLITDEIAIVTFGMWILFSGVNRSAACLALRKAKRKDWYWGLACGGLCIIGGVYAFLNPLLSGFGMVVVLGAILILEGANGIIIAVQMRKIVLEAGSSKK